MDPLSFFSLLAGDLATVVGRRKKRAMNRGAAGGNHEGTATAADDFAIEQIENLFGPAAHVGRNGKQGIADTQNCHGSRLISKTEKAADCYHR